MSEPVRKKSASSDSELSDGWSLVEHSDTAPLTPGRAPDITPQLHSPVTPLQPTVPTSPSEETSSDAESVEIIHDESRLADFTYPVGITRLTPVPTVVGEGEKDVCEKSGLEVKEVLLSESSSSDYFISSNLYSNECFRLVIFISSLVALLLLLVSYTSLFFKEQAYSKSDGLIVLPDEDLSSLIADLALLKEENKRLKQELNLANYDYKNDKKVDSKLAEQMEIASSDDIIGLEVISNESPLQTEPITFKPVTNSFERGKATEKLPTGNLKAGETRPEKQLEDLIQLEDNLNRFAASVGLNNIVVSSYNIAHNLESINSIVINLKSIIDKETSSKKESKKYQLEQKLVKFHNKIEQDFKKSLEKVAKRVNKFHDEFLSAFCRIKGDQSVAEHIDCGKLYQRPKEHHHKDHKQSFNKQPKYPQSENDANERNSASKETPFPKSEDSSSPEKLNQEMDYKLRYKREGDYNKDFKTDHKSDKHEYSNHQQKHKKTEKHPEKYNKPEKGSHYNNEHNHQTLYDNNAQETTHYDNSKQFQESNIKFKEERNKDKQFREHKDKDNYKDVKTQDWKKDKANKYDQNYDGKKKRENQHLDGNINYDNQHVDGKNNHGNQHLDGKKNYDNQHLDGKKDYDNQYYDGKKKHENQHYDGKKKHENQHVDGKKNFDSKMKYENQFLKNDVKIKFEDISSFDENREKKNSDDIRCPRNNCGKQSQPKTNKNNIRFHKVEQDFVKFGNSGRNQGARPIHNESIYSKIINGKPKTESNGEWYLDLGEVRNQKRMRRAMRDRSGWLFDRALVREWCRTNSGSSLCASFGQICDYCG